MLKDLIKDIDSQIIKIRTKSLDVSFNELYDMYENNELVISPDYQRLFRWNINKQSRFIESLILEMPVPPIFVIEIDNGVYELIDGLQRISSYLAFRGLKIGENKDEEGPLKLSGCDIIQELDGNSFDTLPKTLQIKLKRTFVRMEVIRKESEPSLKYHMFKRLNTGGESLSAQEIRNCTIRLLDPIAIDFIKECSQNSDFKNILQRIDQKKLKAQYDQELVLRFFAMKNDLISYKNPVPEYLTQFLEKITTGDLPFNYKQELAFFKDTFEFLNKNIGPDIFSSKVKKETIKNDFVQYLFDSISVAIAKNINNIKDDEKKARDIVNELEKIKISENLEKYKTGNINSVRARFALFQEGVEKVIGR